MTLVEQRNRKIEFCREENEILDRLWAKKAEDVRISHLRNDLHFRVVGMYEYLLSLSKKSKWPILIILAPLKINNLQATENRKMPGFKVFRQPRYFP